MLHPKHKFSGFKIAIAITVLVFSGFTKASAQAGTSVMEPVSAGALIIAMDNDRQGDGPGCFNSELFNLRAYGLAVRLLHSDIPLKWSILDGKAKDGNDFVANATRITGFNCQNGGANTPFAGGPLIIPAAYAALALPVINTFNAEIGGTANDVRIYQVNAGFVAPIRYTLTHKPLIAVGPDGGGFGNGIHQDLYNRAKLRAANNQPYYANVNNETIDVGSCYTIATQAHAADSAINFIDEYRAFAESGGNLFLQCYSVEVFENNINFGRFQTTMGWTLFGTNPGTGDVNTTLAYPNPAIPFSQFVGMLGNQDGRVTEFSLANNSAYRPTTQIAARNSGGHSSKNVATVSRIGSATSGGYVFEMGGHDYSRTTGGGDNNTALGRLNGERMLLNAILTPSFRSGCGLAIPQVVGYKHVEFFANGAGDVAPLGFLNPGDEVTWTVRYINDSNVPTGNFQISDTLQAELTYQGPVTVTVTGAGTSAAANPNYDGDTDTNLLAPGAVLGAGGMITVKIRTTLTAFTEYLNHPTASGTGMPDEGVKTDTVDNTTGGTTAGYTIACGSTDCYPQDDWQTGGLDPTGILVTAPTAGDAFVEGRVIDVSGRALKGVSLAIQDAESGEIKWAITNPFGYYRFEQLDVGRFYTVSVSSKRYAFSISSHSFTLNDSVSGLTFVSTGPGGGSTRMK